MESAWTSVEARFSKHAAGQLKYATAKTHIVDFSKFAQANTEAEDVFDDAIAGMSGTVPMQQHGAAPLSPRSRMVFNSGGATLRAVKF